MSTAGTSTEIATTRDNALPGGYTPHFEYTGNIPIVDAEAAVDCARGGGPQLDPWPLPDVDPAPFSLPTGRIEDGDWAVNDVFASSTGWWLIQRVKGGAGVVQYQWVGPDGRVGSSWSSPWYTFRSETNRAVSGPDGRLYLEVTGDNVSRTIVRVGPNGFDRVAHLPHEGWSWDVGGPVVGPDGGIYVAYDPVDPVGPPARLARLDPETLVETAGVALPLVPVEIAATTQGIVVYSYADGETWVGGEKFIRVPYEAITAGVVDADVQQVLAYGGGNVITATGRNGTVAAIAEEGFCDAAVSGQHPDGSHWLTNSGSPGS